MIHFRASQHFPPLWQRKLPWGHYPCELVMARSSQSAALGESRRPKVRLSHSYFAWTHCTDSAQFPLQWTDRRIVVSNQDELSYQCWGLRLATSVESARWRCIPGATAYRNAVPPHTLRGDEPAHQLSPTFGRSADCFQ